METDGGIEATFALCYEKNTFFDVVELPASNESGDPHMLRRCKSADDLAHAGAWDVARNCGPIVPWPTFQGTCRDLPAGARIERVGPSTPGLPADEIAYRETGPGLEASVQGFEVNDAAKHASKGTDKDTASNANLGAQAGFHYAAAIELNGSTSGCEDPNMGKNMVTTPRPASVFPPNVTDVAEPSACISVFPDAAAGPPTPFQEVQEAWASMSGHSQTAAGRFVTLQSAAAPSTNGRSKPTTKDPDNESNSSLSELGECRNSSSASTTADEQVSLCIEGKAVAWATDGESFVRSPVARDDPKDTEIEKALPPFLHFEPAAPIYADIVVTGSGGTPMFEDLQDQHVSNYNSVAVPFGSRGHATGTCKPCAHFWKPNGCNMGDACERCHLCDEDAFRRYKEEYRAVVRKRQTRGKGYRRWRKEGS